MTSIAITLSKHISTFNLILYISQSVIILQALPIIPCKCFELLIYLQLLTMKKQLFIDIPDSPKPNPASVKKYQAPISLEWQGKMSRSIESISSEEIIQSARHLKEPKFNVVEFEEFKIDQAQVPPKTGELSQINVDLQTPKVEIDQRNYPCKQPPAPNKGSSKTKVFAFPIPATTAKQSKQSKQYENNIQKQLQECKKQLLYKDGQISMLQKFITQHIGKTSSVANLKDAEKIIQQKDKRIQQLINKIEELVLNMRERSQELAATKYDNYRLKSQISHLQNELYLISKKQLNRQSTQQFYDLKRINEQQSNGRFSLKNQPSKNIEDLQRRLNFLKTNNLQLQISKTKLNKYHRDSWNSQTSTNKARRNIDFRMETDGQDRKKHIKHY